MINQSYSVKITGKGHIDNFYKQDIEHKHEIIPLQYPPQIEYFTDREKELERLLKALEPGRRVTLCGPGGIGKSALASKAIWELAPNNKPSARFPDGII